MVAPLAGLFPAKEHPRVLVGLGAADDAAVYDLGHGRVAVVTLDVFPPVVDDAADYGAIAAANSLSDVWAMGADPALALNIAMFPADMPVEVSQRILMGAAERVREAGAAIAGGHTMDAKEPAFGLTVIGFAQVDELMIKGGLHPGQRLVLTKPLGSGLLTTAAKRGKLGADGLASAVEVMRHLNAGAAQAARAVGVRSATDITGFGLAGHALEMAGPSGLAFASGSTPCRCWPTCLGGRVRGPSREVATGTGPISSRRCASIHPSRRRSSCWCSTPRPAAVCCSPWRRIVSRSCSNGYVKATPPRRSSARWFRGPASTSKCGVETDVTLEIRNVVLHLTRGATKGLLSPQGFLTSDTRAHAEPTILGPW